MEVKNWVQWIKEIKLYSVLPSFLESVVTNKDIVECLFDIFSKVELTKKEWTMRENSYVCMLYDCLSTVFKADDTMDMRKLALENSIIETILKRIEIISKEIPRKWIDQKAIEEEELKKLDVQKKT